MSDDLDWKRDGPTWPHHEASRFVEAGGLRWHVQQMGAGPVLLLVHGTGASTHSWRDLMPTLARHFTVIAVDLPGHGFTSMPSSQIVTLPGMAGALTALLRARDAAPALAVGHSAAVAVLARMALDGMIAPRGIVSLNGALAQFRGVAKHVFGPLAKLLVLNPLVPRLFTWSAGRRSVEKLIRDTGSTLSEDGIDLYVRLMRSPAHVRGALAMMANWDLAPLERDMPKLGVPLLLVAAGGDLAVPADVSVAVRERVPGAKLEYLRGVGHLAHEERSAEVAEIIMDWGHRVGAIADVANS